MFIKGLPTTAPTALTAASISTALGFTTGSVVFMGATALAQDNANFFWDDTNNYLGLGTAVPTAPLHIVKSALAATVVAGLTLANATASLVGTPVQNSPAILFTGNAWNTGTPANNANVSVQLVDVPVSAATAYGSLRIRQQQGSTGSWYEAVRIDAQPSTAEPLLDINFYRAVFWSGGYNSPRAITANAFRGLNPQTATATATFGMYFGYGYNATAATVGTDTFAPTTAGGRAHCIFNSIYNPNAAGLAANWAAVQINPTFSGDSGTGYATALAVALKTSVTTTGQVNIVDFGTTGTDYFTGYESKLRLTNDANATSLYLNHQTATKNVTLALQTAGVVRGYVAYFAGLGTGLSLYASTAIGWRVERDAAAAGQEVFRVVGPADTAKTAGTERYDVYFNLNRTVQFATGALTTQRAVYIEAPTYAFVGASTITTASTFVVNGQPLLGANATITNSWAGWFSGSVNIIRGAVTTATPSNPIFKVGGGADTNRAAGVEYIDVHFDLQRNTTWATGAIATQRTMALAVGKRMIFAAASTVTEAIGLEVTGSPYSLGPDNGTITDSYIAVFRGGNGVSNGVLIEGAYGDAHSHALILRESGDEVMPGIAWEAVAGFTHSVGPSAPRNTEKGSGVLFLRSNGLASPGEKTQACIMWEDSSVTVIAEGPAS